MKYNNKILEAVNRGIKLALDDYEDNGDINQVSSKHDIIRNENEIKSKIDFWNQFVDLGLPSGTLWSRYNLGVDHNKLSKPEDWYGNYYAWGETQPKEAYTWDTYQFDKNLIKYNEEDNLTELQFIDDAATQNMHLHNFKFKMPAKADFEELLKHATNKWIENYQNIDKLNGILFKGKNGNELFMPAVACSDSSGEIGMKGRYWSSSLYADNPLRAWYFYLYDEGVRIGDYPRCRGFNVRPVLMK